MDSTAPHHSSIPLIDIAPFIAGDRSDRRRVAAAVDRACRDLGFLIVTGHGVHRETLSDVQGAFRSFFARPEHDKTGYAVTPERYRGYVPCAAETFAQSLDQQSLPDLRESYVIGPIDTPADAYHTGPEGSRYFTPNLWPDEPRSVRPAAEAFYREMGRLAGTMMDIFALGLGLPESFFADKIDRHITILGAMYYPALERAPHPGQLRSGAHTDYGSLTMVYTDTDVGGIEVLTPRRQWLRVPYVPDAFIVNLGDLMAEWTNDRWVSTLHRVGLPGPRDVHRDRLSVIFFHQPNYDAVIECLPTCSGPGNPPRYSRITSGAHREAKIAKHRAPHSTAA
jgi:isopenicillin N synthase-like dioxygenase